MGMARVEVIRSHTRVRRNRRPDWSLCRTWLGTCNWCTFWVESSSWRTVMDEMVRHARGGRCTRWWQ